jgi:hypothetical protein
MTNIKKMKKYILLSLVSIIFVLPSIAQDETAPINLSAVYSNNNTLTLYLTSQVQTTLTFSGFNAVINYPDGVSISALSLNYNTEEDVFTSTSTSFVLTKTGGASLLNFTGSNSFVLATFNVVDGYTNLNFNISGLFIEHKGTVNRTGTVTLPITLKSFTATKLEGSNAILNWTTSSERNASHFEIERSFDLEYWKTLGQEVARGQHGVDTDYSYLDQNIIAQRNNSGVVYYRLQMVDIDGTRKTSDIRSINLDPLTETYYQAFPNPAKGTLNVQLQVPGTTEDMTSLFLIDNAGKLHTKTAISTNGITTLDVNDLPKGVYHLQVNTGQEVLTKKVILVQD